MNETLKGALDRAVLVLVTWFLTTAVQNQWVPQNVATELAPLVPIFLGAAIAYIVNRPKAQAVAAAKTGAVVITSPEIAEATPDNANILPNNAPAAEIAAAVKDARRNGAR